MMASMLSWFSKKPPADDGNQLVTWSGTPLEVVGWYIRGNGSCGITRFKDTAERMDKLGAEVYPLVIVPDDCSIAKTAALEAAQKLIDAACLLADNPQSQKARYRFRMAHSQYARAVS